ncbi:MAG TPA: hypothetical protein VN878_03480 [Usitatibacter sp.]|nr:hypothetical protein [Usitatibacter sp.]
MKKYLAIGLVCSLPTGLAAEDPNEPSVALGTVNVLVIEESVPIVKDVACARNPGDKATECMAFHRAVLTARTQKVSALQERGRWM